MELLKVIESRRAYRSLEPAVITRELIDDLAGCAQLAPSCFNNQPWRFVFVYSPEMLQAMMPVFKSGNEWCHADSMIIAVLTRVEYDCHMKDGREYALFDVGMATALLILRATELGLVAHPIAGYNPEMVREVLGIPPELSVVTLVNVGKHGGLPNPVLSEQQVIDEQRRPPRKPLGEFVHIDRYVPEQEKWVPRVHA